MNWVVDRRAPASDRRSGRRQRMRSLPWRDLVLSGGKIASGCVLEVDVVQAMGRARGETRKLVLPFLALDGTRFGPRPPRNVRRGS